MSEAANRRSSVREMPGALRQTWYCSVSLRLKTTLGGGAATSGGRALGFRAGGGAFFSVIWRQSSTRRSWSTFPAAATTIVSPT